MDRIKKIIQVGSYNGETNEWSNNNGQAYVLFEDDAIAPVVLEHEDMYKAYEALGKQLGIDVSNPDALGDVIKAAAENGVMEFCNKENVEELNAANALLAAENERAQALGRGRGTGSAGGVIPTVTPPSGGDGPNGTGEGGSGDDPEEVEDYREELASPVKVNKHIGRKILAGVLVAGAGFSAGFTASQMMHQQAENTRDVDDDADKDQDQTIDFNTATFDELMDSMSDDDVRKVASQTAMDLVENFHEATHKEGNFRLAEDGETYLDLSFEEALVLTTFANYSEPEQLYEIFGTYNITSTQAQDLLESARTKMITYYMNAIEPSGLAEMFQSDEDRAFFQNFESEVITFNAMHSTDTSDQVIRDVYYNYILDGATNYPNVGSVAKLLSIDAVYGGLNLVESASTEHTQFLQFHGMGEEAETRYYVENILHLNYDELSAEEIATYRTNIIESGTELVSLLPSGEVMTEDNSTAQELEGNVSITDLVDKMGLCNAVNSEIAEKVQALDTMEANHANMVGQQITVVNNSISMTLREAGLDELADRVDQSLTTALSDDLLSEIRAASSEAEQAVENYENKIATINDENRPTMEQIINAANRHTALLENYAGSMKDVATLINNRRHVEAYSYEADKNGYIGVDESGIPIYDSSVLDGKSQEEIDEFVKENGVVIDEKTETTTEEVTEDELTEEEKEQVEEEKAVIEAQFAKDNAAANGQITANSHANSSFYAFSPSSVTNPANGEVYDLNSMTFANGVAYSQAFGGNVPSTSDSQIQNAAEVAAENYLNGISSADQEAIANGMGTSWANARAQLKEAYKSGYITQMQTEISTAISVGNEMKAATEAAMKEVDELNKGQTEETAETTPETQPSEDENSNTDPGIQEGEEAVETTPDVQPNEDENTNSDDMTNDTGAGEDTPNAAPDESTSEVTGEEEYDPNIGEQFQEGEILIEDADGNKVDNGGEVELPVQPAPEVEVQSNVVEETKAEPVVEATPAVEEVDIEAAVEQAYQEALAQEAAAAAEETTEKTR